MATRLVAEPLDDIMERYGKALGELGPGKATKVLARGLNYEGGRAFVQVKRALRKQSSIPTAVVNKGVKTQKASVKPGGALQFAIMATGRPLSLKVFSPRQFGAGTKATVWGRRQVFPGSFMGPRPGVIADSLHGHVFVRTTAHTWIGGKRTPIQKLFGPGLANELVKDQSAQAFYSALPRILDRVGKEIAATLRGF